VKHAVGPAEETRVAHDLRLANRGTQVTAIAAEHLKGVSVVARREVQAVLAVHVEIREEECLFFRGGWRGGSRGNDERSYRSEKESGEAEKFHEKERAFPARLMEIESRSVNETVGNMGDGGTREGACSTSR
jgi:hypothetical protein